MRRRGAAAICSGEEMISVPGGGEEVFSLVLDSKGRVLFFETCRVVVSAFLGWWWGGCAVLGEPGGEVLVLVSVGAGVVELIVGGDSGGDASSPLLAGRWVDG